MDMCKTTLVLDAYGNMLVLGARTDKVVLRELTNRIVLKSTWWQILSDKSVNGCLVVE